MAIAATQLFKVLLFLNLLLTVHSQQVFSDEAEEDHHHPLTEEKYRLYLEDNNYNAAFNYDKNGTDWTGLCHNILIPQSPYNLTDATQTWNYMKNVTFPKPAHLVNTTVNQQVVDWKDQQFAFVTRYRPMAINSSMPVNMVHNIELNVNDTDTNGLFGFWAEEPKYYPPNVQPQTHIVEWKFDHIRAHYPSEHRWNDQQTDLEIQLFHTDHLKQALACQYLGKGGGVISLLFNVNSTESNNGFFDTFFNVTPSADNKTSNGTLDISKLLDIASSMKSNISGYIGGDSMPPCTKAYCYYVYEKVFQITQEQLDYFKVKDVKYNARQTNLGGPEKYLYQLRNKGFFVKQ